jgi:outer membrane receptor protein involved in Fe transport
MNIVPTLQSTSFKKKILATSIAIAIGSVFSFNVYAENENTQVEDKPTTGYEKIMVTGQKISRTLQETPASIAVFTDAKLEEQNIGDIAEVLFETANVHSKSNGGFNIRGIDGFNVSGAGSSDLATVYIDNAALPSRMVSNGFSTWDASQIEIFRGPQSTIQGRNSLAGAVIVTTKAPTHQFGGKYRVQLGQHGEQEFAVAAGGSLIKDELAVRFSAENESFDGFNKNITRNENSDFRKDELYRLKLLYTPLALPELSAQFSFTNSTTDRGVRDVNLAASGDQFEQRFVTNNDEQELNYENNIINFDVNYEINDSLTLTSLTTYTESDTSWDNYDNDNGPEDEGVRGLLEEAESLSQELRLTFNYDQFSGVAGAYYYKQEQPVHITGVSTVSLASAGVNSQFLQAAYGLDAGTAGFVVAQYENFDPVQIDQDTKNNPEVTSFALFADATYEINEQWDVWAGVRWDKEEQSTEDTQIFSIGNLSDMPDVANYPAALQPLIAGINSLVISQVDDANGDIPLADGDFNEIIPKLGVSYHVNDDITTSFSVQRGYRSGGVGINMGKATVYQYDSEFTTNYELSMRSFWLDGDLMVNTNAFYIDWENQQVNVQLSANSFDSEVQNAGSSEVLGFELEAYYKVMDNLEFSASLGLSDSEFKDFLVVIPTDGDDIVRDLSGRAFAESPKWTSNLGVTYTTDSGIFANVSANYAGSSPSEVDPDVVGVDPTSPLYDFENEGRTLVNIKIGYEWGNLGIYLIGKNLLDEEYIAGAPYGIGRRIERLSLGDPRQMSLSLRGSF